MISKEFLYGIKRAVPVILGFVPVGIAYAIMARQAGLTAFETVFMSLSVFAGASQIMAVGMYAQGAGLIAMIIATFIINLRHVIMSACVFNKIKGEKTGLRLLAAFGVTDEGFAIFTTEKEEKCSAMYMVGILLVTYLSWFAGSVIGAVASSLLPKIIAASLGIAMYAMFIGLLVPGIRRNLRLGFLVAMTACANSAFGMFLEPSWSLVVSTLLGAAAGVFFVDLKEQGDESEA
ncbi:MAG: AzlC family ABC transporter permease [Clostridiales bacterium]|jgi:4-azaleucine resistance transporter AzlC|nr:AzlC family ABC transporter permease [Clostridiales bacterium]